MRSPLVQRLGRPIRCQVGPVAPDGTDVLAAVAQVADLALEDLTGSHELGSIFCHHVLGNGRRVLGDLSPAQSQHAETRQEHQ